MERSTLAANIVALRTSLKLNQTAFAERIGAEQSYVSKWESKGMEPSPRFLGRMASLAGCSVDEFLDEPWSPRHGGEIVGKAPDIPATHLVGGEDETVEIALLDLSFSMGTGTNIDDYIEETPLRFDLSYVRSFTRTPAHRLRLARGVGESMSPTLITSDMVWIDTTQTVLNQQDRIWAVSLYGAAAIKRLRAIGGGKVLVISDNPGVDNQEVDAEDLIIGGRVIRFARDL
jgi:phage repressor protein C with HTH and peptisase S24 domain